MTTYILVAVFTASLLTYYLSTRTAAKTELDRVIRFALGLIALHALQAWVIRVWFPDHAQFDYYMPYGFLYGPSLYFGYQAAWGKAIKKHHVIIHGLPFVCFLLGFIWIAAFPQAFQAYRPLYAITFYGCLSLSLLCYTLWALFFKGSRQSVINREVRILVTQITVIIAFTTVVLAVLTATGFMASHLYSGLQGSLVFLTMLSAVLVHFFYTVKQLTEKPNHLQNPHTIVGPPAHQLQYLKSERPEVAGRYQKSAISIRLLTEYTGRLTESMNVRKVFLEENLTLESLAQQLKIPRHHLSQVLSLKMGKNFNTYINEYRINYAVGLMKTADELSIGDIMHRSGFASKASFNRYFKQFQGCTPSEYRLKIRK